MSNKSMQTEMTGSFYKKKRFYILIFILTMFLLMVLNVRSCVNPDSKLPEEFKIKQQKKEYYFSHYIYEYKVQNKKLDFTILNKYPIRCNKHIKDCQTLDWKIFEELDAETLKNLEGYFQDLNENETIAIIDSLVNIGGIYFSGCYTLMKSSVGTYRFWEYQFYLDTSNKMLYVIDYTEDFLLPGIPNPF